MSFPQQSAFNPSTPDAAREQLSQTLFASTEPPGPDKIVLDKSQIKSLWRDLDDVLWELDGGSARDLERATGDLDRIANMVEDWIKSLEA